MKTFVYDTPVGTKEKLVGRIVGAAAQVQEIPKFVYLIHEEIGIQANGRHFKRLSKKLSFLLNPCLSCDTCSLYYGNKAHLPMGL